MQIRIGTSKSIIYQCPPNLVAPLLKHFSYTNSSVSYQIHKHISGKYRFIQKTLATFGGSINNADANMVWNEELARLKKLHKPCLLKETNDGLIIFPTGLLNKVKHFFFTHSCPIDKSLVDMRNRPPKKIGFPAVGSKPELRYYQKEAIVEALKEEQGTVVAGTGCHPRGQKVLMFDGSIKNVEDVECGDLLMGPDSASRTVLRLIRDRGRIYKIIPHRGGDPLLVNEDHILYLTPTNRGKGRPSLPDVTISVKEYLKKGPTFRHLYKLVRTGVNFPERPLPIPPYILGILLGDGGLKRGVNVTTSDGLVKKAFVDFIENIGLSARVREGSNCETIYATSETRFGGVGRNPLINVLADLGLRVGCHDKFIPSPFKVNSRENRLQLLAGLLDTDGYYDGGCFNYITASKALGLDIQYLCRSLGFSCSLSECTKRIRSLNFQGQYWRLNISGNLDQIPTQVPRRMASARGQKKNHLVSGFRIELVSERDNYFGFNITGDHLYLLGDFTITHNTGKTVIIQEIIRRLGLKAIVVVPSLSILGQTERRFKKYFGAGKVGSYSGVAKKPKAITLACAPSLATSDPKMWEDVDVVILDECHHAPAETIETIVYKILPKAHYRFGFTATCHRTDGADLAIEAAVFPPIYTYTVEQGIKDKYLAQPRFLMFEVGFNSYRRYNGKMPMLAYKYHMIKNKALNQKIIAHANSFLEKGKQVLILVREKSHGHLLHEGIKDAVFIRTKGSEKKGDHVAPYTDPDKAVDDFNAGRIRCLIGTSIIGEGTDIVPVDVLFNLMGGTSRVSVMQNIGRALRPSPGKGTVWIVDYIHSTNDMLEKHSFKRHDIYKKIGKVDILNLPK